MSSSERFMIALMLYIAIRHAAWDLRCVLFVLYANKQRLSVIEVKNLLEQFNPRLQRRILQFATPNDTPQIKGQGYDLNDKRVFDSPYFGLFVDSLGFIAILWIDYGGVLSATTVLDKAVFIIAILLSIAAIIEGLLFWFKVKAKHLSLLNKSTDAN